VHDTADLFAASILVVDDEAAERRLASAILEGAGFRHVEATGDAAAVCALYAEHRFELIVLDLMMPAMDGFAVMEALRREQPGAHLPVLAVASEPDLMRRALESGARDFVAKPLRVAETSARAAGVLQFGRFMRELEERRAALERDLARAQTRYRALVEQSLVGIYIMENERVVYANPMLCELVGYGVDEVTSKAWRDIVLEADRGAIDGVLACRRSGDRSPVAVSCRVRCRDGRIAHVRIESKVVEIDGHPVSIGIVQDVTAQAVPEPARSAT
jgi:PAS domain S-box-containing protein